VPRSSRPGPHPLPPDDLRDRDLPIVALAGPLHRLHRASRAPLFFGRTGENRFDDPAHAFGVLYAGESEACAFIETFAEPLDVPFVTVAQLAGRKLSVIQVLEPLRLVSLAGADLRRIRADARLFAADHAVAQAWARALHDHPAGPDGLRYPARHDPGELAVAVFDRAKAKLQARVAKHTLADPGAQKLIARLLDKYGLGLV
jgi:RES domain-containing protein